MTAGADDETLPGVSYVMPVLNEAHYIEAAVASILAQHYPAPTEIVLALGPSADGTDAIVERLHERDPRIRAVHNPQAHIQHGLNLAIRDCRYPVIVRVDAHTELPADYTLRAVANDYSGDGGGGFQCCWTNGLVKVTVAGGSTR